MLDRPGVCRCYPYLTCLCYATPVFAVLSLLGGLVGLVQQLVHTRTNTQTHAPHKHIHIHIHTYKRAHTQAHTHACVCLHTHTHTRARAYVYIDCHRTFSHNCGEPHTYAQLKHAHLRSTTAATSPGSTSKNAGAPWQVRVCFLCKLVRVRRWFFNAFAQYCPPQSDTTRGVFKFEGISKFIVRRDAPGGVGLRFRRCPRLPGPQHRDVPRCAITHRHITAVYHDPMGARVYHLFILTW